MKKRNKLIFAAIVSIALVSSGVAAAYHHHSPEDYSNYMTKKISSKLDLTDEQVSQLTQLKTNLLGLRKSILSERGNVHREITELLEKPILDRHRTLKLVQAYAEPINHKAPQIIATFASFYDSLNTEQQAILREKLQEHKEHNNHWLQ